MTYFEALPVKGDAFLLATDRYHLLVDGGGSAITLAKALAGVSRLDVVICTHADRDHAGGLTKILSVAKFLTVGEFWLPGAWTDYLEDLVLRPAAFAAALGEDIYEIFADGWSADAPPESEDDEPLPYDLEILNRTGPLSDLDRRTDELSVVPSDGETQPVPADDWFAALGREYLNSAGARLPDARTVAAASARARPFAKPLTKQQAKRRHAILVDAIDTAQRIREIAIQAIAHRVKVRWFDFSAFKLNPPSGGWPGLIQPVNACELVVPPPRPRVSRVNFIALTTVNLESLVFQAVERPGIPAVLFCADSPLTGGRHGPWPGLPRVPLGGILMTAPHHGRVSNAGAYAIAEGWLPGSSRVFTWVRSGGLGLPCAELLGRRRFCTACGPTVGATTKPAKVRLDPSPYPYWGWWSPTLPCAC